ncbi:hypothetical protein IWX78_002569 [Mycetocola sp. CAN_C7]|uniref:DUF4129 domain-containing protein n=1 Tax=Mycetocola sp. CAN_C7 TaxID=2787724 RepID=UPI0018C95BE4
MGLVGTVRFDVPVVPDAPEARDWLLQELSRPEYAAAQPSLFDVLSQEFFAWLARLFQPGDSVPLDWLPVLIVGLVVVALVVALLIWGVPRANRRSRPASGLFGDADRRTAAQLRSAAAKAAAEARWTLAVLEQFRAIARGLDERTVVFVSPGTTAHDFAGRASSAFPAVSTELREAADVFDRVRYLGEDGTSDQYQRLRALDGRVQSETPAVHETIERMPVA